ncbi:hypothetical protein Sango_1938600 [Sesamum angolense]|uniref:Small nuclear RNA activating complex (SNAPc), subunit SNAP43 n=1 Tax=Sesamum angolense TaxID=2727404 RepID=A0AAE2BNC9_9LAMI|nr:hypothetical protein Sango_1938600 [Sesamum angolense]
MRIRMEEEARGQDTLMQSPGSSAQPITTKHTYLQSHWICCVFVDSDYAGGSGGRRIHDSDAQRSAVTEQRRRSEQVCLTEDEFDILSRNENCEKVMDLKPFKLDIDELINEFAECESTTFAEFKRVWLSRKLSFIFEASPSTNRSFFMQSLYAHSIGYMVSSSSLSNKLGGLYCLYCLYETQPFKPPYRIYLSLGELRQLKNLAIESKAKGLKVVSALLKIMLERNMFLFGFVGVNEGSPTERVNELTDIQNARVQAAYKKLFANSRLEHFIHMDLGVELEVDLLKRRSSDYALAKELAIKEGSQVIDVQNVKHITENKRLIGEMVEKTAADWNSQKELFYEQTGFAHLSVAAPPQQQSSNENSKRKEPCENLERQQDNDNFGKELEEVLLFQSLECDDEEAEHSDPSEEET